MKIICFGDSLTFGYGVPINEKWHVIVEEKTGIKMVNRGVCGNTTTEMLARFQRQVLLQKPDGLILMGGYNDIFFEGTWETAKNHLLTMIREAQQKEINVFVAVPPPILCLQDFFCNDSTMDFEKIHKMSEAFCEWLRCFLEEKNWPYINFGAEVDWKKDNLYLDGIHPNSQGSRLMADKVITFLDKQSFL